MSLQIHSLPFSTSQLMEIQNSFTLFVAGVKQTLFRHGKKDFSLANETTEVIVRNARRRVPSDKDRRTECGAEQYMRLGEFLEVASLAKHVVPIYSSAWHAQFHSAEVCISKGFLEPLCSLYLVKEKENWEGVAAVQTRNSTISHDMSCYADVFAFESSVMIEDLTTIAAKVSEGGAFHSKIGRTISEMGVEGEMGDRYGMGEGVDVSIPFMLVEKTGSSISVERAEIMELVHAILSHIGRNG